MSGYLEIFNYISFNGICGELKVSVLIMYVYNLFVFTWL